VTSGYENYNEGYASMVFGQEDTITSTSQNSFIGGGAYNKITSNYAFIGGGSNNTVTGDYANAFGLINSASGIISNVFGIGNNATSFAETVFGTYATGYSPNSTINFNVNDRLFVIGNGAGSGTRSNAITVLKSGNTGIGHDTPVSSLDVDGSLGVKVKTGLTAGTDDPDGEAVVYIYSGGTGNIALPTATTVSNRVYTIVNSTGGSRTITSYVNLSGGSVTSIGNGTSIELISDGANWYQIR
jgi:hypothetical protein